MRKVCLKNRCILFELTPDIFLRYLLILRENNNELFVGYIGFINSLLLSKIVNDSSLYNSAYFQKINFYKNVNFFQIIVKQHIIHQKFQKSENINQFLDMQRHFFRIERTPVCSRTFKTLFSTRNLHYPKFIVSISPIYQS